MHYGPAGAGAGIRDYPDGNGGKTNKQPITIITLYPPHTCAKLQFSNFSNNSECVSGFTTFDTQTLAI